MNTIQQNFFVIKGNQSTISTSLPIPTSLIDFTHVSVSSLSIPKTFYTLPSDAKIIISENNQPEHVLVFSKGNYTSQTFLSILNNKFATAGLDYDYVLTYPDLSLEPDTGKYTLTVSNNLGNDVDITIEDEYLSGMLGLDVNTTYTFSSTLESDNVISFQVYDKLIIKSNLVANQSALLQDVVSSANPYFSNIVYQNTNLLANAKRIESNVMKNNIFTFTILNSLNKPIDLNGSTWSIVIAFFTIDPVFKVVREYIEMMVMEETKKNL